MLLETQCAAMSVNERLEYSDNHAPCYHTIARRTRSCGCSARSSPSKVTPMLISVRVLRHIYVSSKVRREHTDNADDGIPVVAESHDTHARRRPVITRCMCSTVVCCCMQCVGVWRARDPHNHASRLCAEADASDAGKRHRNQQNHTVMIQNTMICKSIYTRICVCKSVYIPRDVHTRLTQND